MIGIDYLRLVATPTQVAESVSVDRLAADYGLSSETLERFVAAVKSEQTEQALHPFHLVRLAGQQRGTNKVAELLKRINAKLDSVAEKRDNSILFADFSGGIPQDWFVTGTAFGSDERKPSSCFAIEGPVFSNPNSVYSNGFGGDFYGVLRSPTF